MITASLPPTERLRSVIGRLLAERNQIADPIEIIAREPNVQKSTFPSELVTCRSVTGEEWRIFCKYAGEADDQYGQRGGVEREALVYREVLEPLPISTPHFYGRHVEGDTRRTWLFLQALDPIGQLQHSSDPAADVLRAATWLGRFHALNESRINDLSAFLNRYDEDYYRGWARRTVAFSGPLNRTYPWLAGLADAFTRDLVPALAAHAPTIIHGEYYPKNILVQDRVIYPVDWESGAVAAGELDLATLLEGWAEKFQRTCEEAYRTARWQDSAPDDFPRSLAAARMYTQFRWLGDWPECTPEPPMRRHFDRLPMLGRALGII